MHYFKRNIGDYHKKAGRLSMLQHGAYTLLLDACYDRERFPTEDDAIEWCWASTPEEEEAVRFVLRRFFELIDGVYVQHRIQEEIENYQAKSEKNRQIALEREANRREKRTKRAQGVHESSQDDHEAPPNHKPLTINQEPLTKNQEKEHTDDSDESPSPVKYSDEDRNMAISMLKLVQEVSPSQKASKSWPDTIRLMRERDKHTHEEIWAMFMFANNHHEFWRANILCPATLRKQWPKLEAQRARDAYQNEGPVEMVKRLNREREAAEEAQGSSECLDVDFTNLGFH